MSVALYMEGGGFTMRNKKFLLIIGIFCCVLLLSGCITTMEDGYFIHGYVSDISIRDIDGKITHYVFLINNIGFVTLVYNARYSNIHFDFFYRGNATIEFGKRVTGDDVEDVFISMTPEINGDDSL